MCDQCTNEELQGENNYYCYRQRAKCQPERMGGGQMLIRENGDGKMPTRENGTWPNANQDGQMLIMEKGRGPNANQEEGEMAKCLPSGTGRGPNADYGEGDKAN